MYVKLLCNNKMVKITISIKLTWHSMLFCAHKMLIRHQVKKHITLTYPTHLSGTKLFLQRSTESFFCLVSVISKDLETNRSFSLMKERALTCFHPVLNYSFWRFHEAEMLLLSDNTPWFRFTRLGTEKLIIAEKICKRPVKSEY